MLEGLGDHFSVSPDMALEQSLNRDVKCVGELIGVSNEDNGRNNCSLTAHIKGDVAAELNPFSPTRIFVGVEKL